MSVSVVGSFASVAGGIQRTCGRHRGMRRAIALRASTGESPAETVDPDIVGDATTPRGTGVRLPAVTWTSREWNWGSANGTAHDAAMAVRGTLNTESERRREWLVALISSTPTMRLVPWEEAKLVMALAWQLSGHRGTDKCDGGGGSWLELMERMRQGVYEDTEEKSLSGGGDRALVFEMSQRLGDGGKGLMKQAEDVAREATDGDEEWTHDAVRRAACAAMLLDLEFLEVGI